MIKEIINKLIDLISPYSKKGLENLTGITIIVFSLIFCYIFIVSLEVFQNFPSWLLYLATPAIFYLITVNLFSSDTLYYGDPGKNKYVRAFQMYLPSKHISEKFNLDIEKAKNYWFENIFNTWSRADHPRYEQRIRTFRRGYACRFVYYSIKFLGILFWISILLTLTQEILIRLIHSDFIMTSVGLGYRIGFIMLIGLVYILIRITNKTSPSNMTGVWRRFAEINKMHIHWIDENIKSIDDLKMKGTIKTSGHKIDNYEGF